MSESDDSAPIADLRSLDESELSKREKREPRRRKERRARVDAHAYLDMEAEVSSGEEEEDSADAERLKNLYRQRREDWRERFNASEEQLLEHFQKLEAEEEEREADDGLLPTLRDPALFRVRCHRGAEREAVVRMLAKHGDVRAEGVSSVSALDKLPGFVFVEAAKAVYVKQLVAGLRGLNADSISQVRLSEIAQVFAPDPTRDTHIEPLTFVEVSGGLYQGDLALVLSVEEEGGLSARVKLVPRLPPPGAGSETAVRPPPALFDAAQHAEATLINTKDFSRKTYTFNRQTFQNGFLLKKVRFRALRRDIPTPPLAAIKLFLDDESEERCREILARLGLSAEQRRLRERNLSVGERVVVARGDLVGIAGTVIEILGETARVELDAEEIREPIAFRQIDLNKFLEVGDAVEIVSGLNAGGRGTIVRMENGKAAVIAEARNEEFLVELCDLRLSRGVAAKSVATRGAQPRIGDLVSLAEGGAALVTGVDGDGVSLIDANGAARRVARAALSGRLPSNGFARNCFEQDIGPRCSVKVRGGANKDCRALVKAVSGNVAFLCDPTRGADNIFIEDVNNCLLIDSYEYDRTRFNGRLNNPNTLSTVDGERRQSAQSARTALIGQKRKVLRGEWKGYEGVIRSIVGDNVKLELSARPRVVTVPIAALNGVATTREAVGEPMQVSFHAAHLATPVYNPNGQF